MIVLEVNRALLGKSNQCQQLIQLLPQIKGVGFDALYLLPVVEKGAYKAVGSPYCIRDFWKLDPEFGNEQDWAQLQESCREMQIEIWMDWVMNHTAWDHPWIQQHPDWYVQSPTSKEITHPPGTDWMDVAQLNWRHPELLSVMSELAQRWHLERGIVGLRCDAAYRISSDIWKDWICKVNDKSKSRIRWIADQEINNWKETGFTGYATSGKIVPSIEGAWNKLYDHDRAAFGPLWNAEDEYRIEQFSQANLGEFNWIVGMGMMDKEIAISFFESQSFPSSKWRAWLKGLSFGH
jgi:glycosidase